MVKYDKLVDYIFVEKSRFDNDFKVTLNIVKLISDISKALGKREVFRLKNDVENVGYMEKYIENRLEDEFLFLNEFEEWCKNYGDINIEEDAEQDN